MITRDVRLALEKMDKLHEALKNIHLLEKLPDILKTLEEINSNIEKNKKFKDKVETK